MPSDKTVVTWGWAGREEQEGLITKRKNLGQWKHLSLIAIMASQVYVCESHQTVHF